MSSQDSSSDSSVENQTINNGNSDSNNKPSDAEQQQAEKLKEQANEFFKQGAYEKAIAEYTAAINIAPSHIYYSNRSLAYLRTECYGAALEDATLSIQAAAPTHYTKAYYRRASANMALGKFKMALADFETVVKVTKSRDKDALNKLSECRKIVQRQQFEKAIHVSDDDDEGKKGDGSGSGASSSSDT